MDLDALSMVKSKYLVKPGESFSVKEAPTSPPEGKAGKDANRKRREKYVEELSEMQRVLYADDRYSVLVVFQAMDAAGKDSTIRKVFSGVNPAGVQVTPFKGPSANELDHDYLWRIHQSIPSRGTIGVFNRSHYEEVLVVKVHPEYLGGQKLPEPNMKKIWKRRYEDINNFEKYLAQNGTIILKFWLNVSQDAQKERFLDRINEEESRWKFSGGDMKERALWPKYMEAYEELLNATSKPWAPWYAIPADDKPYMRRKVAQIITERLRALEMSYPSVSEEKLEEMFQYKRELEGQ